MNEGGCLMATKQTVLVYKRVLDLHHDTKGTYVYKAENELTGRDVTLYIEKVDFKTVGIDVPGAIRLTVEVA